MKEIRKLYADEIDARVSQVVESGAVLLLYKDARVDQRLLDETFGRMNWQRSHQEIDGNLYCTVSVWDEDKKMWVSKQDVGTESYTEAEKGQASDSFKRACFNWGIGRELYTAPFIWCKADAIKKSGAEFVKNSKGKFTLKGFAPKVDEITYAGDTISGLTISNKGEVIFSRGIK